MRAGVEIKARLRGRAAGDRRLADRCVVETQARQHCKECL